MSCLPLPVFTFATTVVKDATADYAGMTLWSALLSVAVHRECHAYLKLLGFSKERRPVTPKVAGSSPVAPAIAFNENWRVRLAQPR